MSGIAAGSPARGAGGTPAGEATGSKTLAWIAALRLPFHPMAFLAYCLGAAAATASSRSFVPAVFWLGYAVLFLIEVCTIFCNEYFDYETDRRNRNSSTFSGGARVLVEGRLTFAELRLAVAALLVLIAVATALLSGASETLRPATILGTVGVGLIAGLGYTVPPLKLCYRGVGEVTVAATHSFYLVLCGHLFQGGALGNPLPWLLSAPLFLAVLAANTLAGIPDREADVTVGKWSLPALLGPRPAIILAMAEIVAAALVALWLRQAGVLAGTPGAFALAVVPHAAVLLVALFALLDSRRYDRRIDFIMGLALSYIIWFGAVPLAALLLGRSG